MLRSISIKNFRSCEDVTIRLDEPVVALIGKNGTGKTNLLHAIKFAADLCVGKNAIPPKLRHRYHRGVRHSTKQTDQSEVALEFTLGGTTYLYQALTSTIFGSHYYVDELLLKNGSMLFRRLDAEVAFRSTDASQPLRIAPPTSALSALLQILPESDSAVAELEIVNDYLISIRYYLDPAELREDPNQQADSVVTDGFAIFDSDYQKWQDAFEVGRADESVLMKLLYLNRNDSARFKEIDSLLGEKGLRIIEKVQISRFNVATGGGGYLLHFLPGRDLAGAGAQFRLSQLSTGTQRIIKLITHLIFDQSSCMLLEQPEDSIHPGLLEQLLDILSVYSDRTQLICTTHSPHTINEIPAAGIRFVTAANGKTAVSELSAEEIDRAKRYIKEDGTFAEFLETF